MNIKSLLVILFIGLLSFSCSKKHKSVDDVIEGEDLTEIKALKQDLSNQQNNLKDEIQKLTVALERLDNRRNFSLVTTETLKDTLFKHYIEVQGDVKTDQNIIIYPEFSGILSKVYVKEGQQVKKGQVLAKIDDGGLSSQLAEAETQLTLAKTTFERRKRLWDQEIGSEIQFLEAKTNYDAMKSSVDQLHAKMGKTTIRAPFSGVIDDVISDEGQVVSPGQNELFRLVNLNEMYVTAQVPENFLGSIDKGTEVLIDLASIGKEYEGDIEQVSNFINPNNRSFQVRVAVPNPDGKVKPNMIATVKLNDYTAEKALLIPQNILQENGKGESVAYIVKKENDSVGTAEKKVVKTGMSYDRKVQILEGLKEGDELIVEGARAIRDGQDVKTH